MGIIMGSPGEAAVGLLAMCIAGEVLPYEPDGSLAGKGIPPACGLWKGS